MARNICSIPISQLSGAAAEDGEDSTEPIPKQTSLPTSAHHHREPVVKLKCLRSLCIVHRLVTYLQPLSRIRSPAWGKDLPHGASQNGIHNTPGSFFWRKWQKTWPSRVCGQGQCHETPTWCRLLSLRCWEQLAHHVIPKQLGFPAGIIWSFREGWEVLCIRVVLAKWPWWLLWLECRSMLQQCAW